VRASVTSSTESNSISTLCCEVGSAAFCRVLDLV
jgi:hypothetical protein